MDRMTRLANGTRVVVKRLTQASTPVQKMYKYVGETGVIFRSGLQLSPYGDDNNYFIVFDNPGVQQQQVLEKPNTSKFWFWNGEDLELVED